MGYGNCRREIARAPKRDHLHVSDPLSEGWELWRVESKGAQSPSTWVPEGLARTFVWHGFPQVTGGETYRHSTRLRGPAPGA